MRNINSLITRYKYVNRISLKQCLTVLNGRRKSGNSLGMPYRFFQQQNVSFRVATEKTERKASGTLCIKRVNGRKKSLEKSLSCSRHQGCGKLPVVSHQTAPLPQGHHCCDKHNSTKPALQEESTASPGLQTGSTLRARGCSILCPQQHDLRLQK